MLGLLFRLGGLLLAGAAATATVAAIVIAVNAIITAGTIREQAKMKCTSAFKAELLSKDRRKVNVGVFDRSDTKISEMTIESSEGVSENLHVGQVIYI